VLAAIGLGLPKIVGMILILWDYMQNLCNYSRLCRKSLCVKHWGQI